MTVTLNIQDADGKPLTSIELFDDVYTHMQTEAALIGVPVSEHIIQIIAGHARDIIDSFEGDTF